MANFKQNFRKALEFTGLIEKAGQSIPSGLGGSDPFAIWQGSKNKISAVRAMAVFSGWTYACVRAIAEEISNMQFKMLKVGADDSSEVIPEHDLLDLLDAPNKYMTGTELKYIIATHLELVGNCYLLLIGVKNDKDQPTAIFPLNPMHMKINRGKTYDELIKSYEYRVGSDVQVYQTYEILHLKNPDPSDPVEGVGTVQAAAQWIDADNYAQEFNRRFFLNGARIGGYLESENARTPEQLDYLRKSFEQIYSGADNAYKTAALPVGTKFKEASATQKDMDFIEGQKMMRDKILAAFRVPKTALGLTEDVNRANAEATDYVFASRTILPKMRMIVGYLNEFLVPRFDQNYYLDVINPIPEDRVAKMEEMKAATGGQPVMSVNEAREQYFGLGPISDGDAVRGNMQMVPMGVPVKKETKPNKTTTKITKSRFAKNTEKRKQIGEEITKQAIDELKAFEAKTKEVKKIAVKDITKLSNSEYEILYKDFAIRISAYEKLLQENMIKVNDSVREQVLNNLGTVIKGVFNSKTKAIDPEDLYDSPATIKDVIDLNTPVAYELFDKEGAAAAALIGFEGINVLTPQTRAALDKAMALLADRYNQTTIDLLQEKIAGGIEAGLGELDMTDLINSIFDYSNEVRAKMVAHTEIFRIANEGAKQGWKETGVVDTIKWYTSEDERVCEFCGPLHGTIVGIEENFFDQGDVYSITNSDGKEQSINLDYSDVGAPPLHINCNCYISPESMSIKTAKKPEPSEKKLEHDKVEEKKQLTDEDVDKRATEIADQKIKEAKGEILKEATESMAEWIKKELNED